MEKTSTKTPKAQVVAVAPPAPVFDAEREIAQLRLAISEIQAIAQISLDQIAAIGNLALAALETPFKTVHQKETVAQAILTMVEKAQMAGDSVSFEAENVGVLYRDEAKERRAAAHHG